MKVLMNFITLFIIYVLRYPLQDHQLLEIIPRNLRLKLRSELFYQNITSNQLRYNRKNQVLLRHALCYLVMKNFQNLVKTLINFTYHQCSQNYQKVRAKVFYDSVFLSSKSILNKKSF